MAFIPSLRRIRSRVFYGWWIVAGAAAMQGLFSLLYYQSFGAYLVFFKREFNWGTGALSGAYAMARLESSIIAPIQGWLLDKLSPRMLMRVGAVMVGGGFIMLSQVNSLFSYYVAYAIISIGASLAGFLTINITVARWFERWRTRAISLTMIGGGIGGLGAPLLAWSLETFGWRETAFVSGVATMLVCLPLAQLMRESPERYGMLPDGDLRAVEHGDEVGDDHRRVVLEGFTLKQALRNQSFWYLGIGHGMALLAVSVINTHLIIHLVQLLDLSVTAAAAVFTVILATQVVAQVIGGIMGDRYSKRLLATGAMIGHALAMLILAMTSALWLIFAAAIIHGAAWGIRGPLMTTIRAEYFGRRALGTIMGFGTTFAMVGSTIGPVFAGLMVDITGSYRLAFFTIAVVVGLSAFSFLLAVKPDFPGRPVTPSYDVTDGEVPV